MKKINLLDYKKRVYSVPGNDGIIEYIFKKLRINNGIFVEFGAWDGIKNSNCRKLLEEGWNGIFIESNISKYNNLVNNYKKYKHIYCCNNFVGFEGSAKFDNIVDPYLNGKQIDFCSIDIDGLDLEVFETFEKYLPTVVCIEGGQVLHPYHKRVDRKVACNKIGQSLKVTIDSFEKKGYKILCSYQDCFFVKKEFYNLFNVENNIIKLYFNGLRERPQMIAYYDRYMKEYNSKKTVKYKIKNNIIAYVLKKSLYAEKWRPWLKKKYNKILSAINKKEKIELAKKYKIKNNIRKKDN